MILVFLVLQNYISILTQCQLRIPNFSFFYKKNPFLGELFHLILRVLDDNWSKIMGDELKFFDCMHI
jgi:hypothetical protein